MGTKFFRLRPFGFLYGAIAVWVVASLISCAKAGAPGDTGGGPPSSASAKTIAWQNDGAGYVQYYTNDPANIQSQGYSEWHYYDPSETTMSTVEVKINKINGDPMMASGVIFCVQDASNFLTVTIDTTGFYQIGKVAAGNYTSILAWTDSSGALYSGYSVANDIKVTYNAGSKVFTLYFNGTSVTTFTDPSTPAFTGGRSGFIIGISSSENFPSDAVDIRLKRLSPTPTVP